MHANSYLLPESSHSELGKNIARLVNIVDPFHLAFLKNLHLRKPLDVHQTVLYYFIFVPFSTRIFKLKNKPTMGNYFSRSVKLSDEYVQEISDETGCESLYNPIEWSNVYLEAILVYLLDPSMYYH